MAKKTLTLDESALTGEFEKKPLLSAEPQTEPTESKKAEHPTSGLINCLSNEIIIVRFVAKQRGIVSDPKHVLYGGMASNAKISLSVPLDSTGKFVTLLSPTEQAYLEHVMGLDAGALSVYKRTNNFWDDSNPDGIGTVTLIKGDNRFDMSVPEDFIRLRIATANTAIVAPSLQEYQDRHKATYKFIVIKEQDMYKEANSKITNKQRAYMELGKLEGDIDKMRTVVEMIDGRTVTATTSADYLKGKLGELLESNTKIFLQTLKDPYLDNKVLIKKAILKGVIANRGDFLYYKLNNSPLCADGEHPTLSVAAKFLSEPRNQELKFTIEEAVRNK